LKYQYGKESVMMAFRRLGRAYERRLQRLPPRRAIGIGIAARAQTPAIAIVLPIYLPRLDGEVLAAVDRATATLKHGDWFFIAPMSLETAFYEERYDTSIVRFPDASLDSQRNYSRLLLTDEFYATFAQYEYILLVQDDVYVVRHDLAYWRARGLDYIGAPWPT